MDEGINRFIEQLKSEDSQARVIAVGHLGKLNDERVVLPLVEALVDRSETVRNNAAYALERIIKRCSTMEELGTVDKQIDEGSNAFMEEREGIDRTVQLDAHYKVLKLQGQLLKKKSELVPTKDSYLPPTVRPPKNRGTSTPPKKIKA